MRALVSEGQRLAMETADRKNHGDKKGVEKEGRRRDRVKRVVDDWVVGMRRSQTLILCHAMRHCHV